MMWLWEHRTASLTYNGVSRGSNKPEYGLWAMISECFFKKNIHLIYHSEHTNRTITKEVDYYLHQRIILLIPLKCHTKVDTLSRGVDGDDDTFWDGKPTGRGISFEKEDNCFYYFFKYPIPFFKWFSIVKYVNNRGTILTEISQEIDLCGTHC